MRYVKIVDRIFSSIIHQLPRSYVDYITESKRNHFKWKGLTLMKDPMSLATYQQFLQDFKPKTIIEFGTYDGGSALWMSDILECIGVDCKIYTFDINQVESPKENIITFQSDNYNIKEFVENNKTLFENLEHPVLMIEDSHVNVYQILTEMNKFLISGDYIIIEDTRDIEKHKIMETFLKFKKYSIDTFYCDLWGENNSWNFNSYLIKD